MDFCVAGLFSRLFKRFRVRPHAAPADPVTSMWHHAAHGEEAPIKDDEPPEVVEGPVGFVSNTTPLYDPFGSN